MIRNLLFLLLASPFAHADLFALPFSPGQIVRVMSAIPNDIGFQVTDSSNQLVPNASVTFTVLSGPPGLNGQPALLGFASPPGSLNLFAGADGVVANRQPVYAKLPGTYVIRASSSYGSADVAITVVDGALPARIVKVSGDAQSVAANTAFAPFKVQVLDANGLPFPRAPLQFTQFLKSTVYTANGMFDTTDVGAAAGDFITLTDDNGMATNLSPFRSMIFPGQGVVDAACNAGFDLAHFVSVEIPFTVTAGSPSTPTSFQDMWWGGDAQNGWGLAFIEHDRRMFLIVYAYDAAGKPVWYVVPDAHWINAEGYVIAGTLYQPTGSPYSAFDSSKIVVGASLGTLSVVFLSPGTARVHFNGKSGSGVPFRDWNLSRMTFGANDTNRGVGDMWWGGVSQSGWGISVIEHAGTLFSVWYTYGADGKSTWFVMPGGSWNGADYSGGIYTTTNPTWSIGYSSSQLTVNQAGTYTLHVADPLNAMRMDYTINGASGSLQLSREPF